MPVRIAPLHVLAWQSVSKVKWLHFIKKNNARVSSHLREGTMEVLRSLFAKTTVALKLEDPLTVGVIVWYFYITTACFYRQDLRMCARPRSANRVNFEENIHCKKKTIRVSPVVFSIFASTTWQETVHNVRNLSYTQMRTVKRIFYQV